MTYIKRKMFFDTKKEKLYGGRSSFSEHKNMYVTVFFISLHLINKKKK